MGDNFQVVVDIEATADEAEDLAQKVLGYLFERGYLMPERTHCVFDELDYPPGGLAEDAVTTPDEFERALMTGVEVLVGRQDHGSTEEGPISISCPRCLQTGDDQAWFWAVDDWEHHGGQGLIHCGACEVKSPVTQWIHNPPWQFVNLGFKFWNWPPLRPEVIAEMARILGHPVETVEGMF